MDISPSALELLGDSNHFTIYYGNFNAGNRVVSGIKWGVEKNFFNRNIYIFSVILYKF